MEPHSYRIENLVDPSGDFARQAFFILQASFPIEEIETEEQIANHIRSDQHPDQDHRSHNWMAVQDGRVVGVAIFSYYRKIRMGFLGYLAVDPEIRSQGVGSFLFQHTVEQLPQDAADMNGETPLGLCLEVERPEQAETEAEQQLRRRRIEFYRRLGTEIITGINYIGPPLRPGLPPVPYTLMFRPIDCPHGLDRENIIALVDAIMRNGYGAGPDNPYYVEAMRSIELSRSGGNDRTRP